MNRTREGCQADRQRKQPQKKTYARPQLVKHGNVEKHTREFNGENGTCPTRPIPT